jgi:RNA polymerase sigma-B factor
MTESELTALATAYIRDNQQSARARLIEAQLPLVRRIARRFSGRGERFEDLVQVGSVALVAAVDRCDADRIHTLTAYVTRCVEGEIRRHLRDRSSVVRIPRGERELGGTVQPLPLDDCDAALTSAEAPEDAALTRALVASAARCLDGRERRVVLLHYFLDLSQADVGREVGVSQVHVSRLLRDASAKMRVRLESGAGTADEW